MFRAVVAIGLVALSATVAGAPAHAADQIVSGTIAPTIAVSIDDIGTTSGTSPSAVTRERRGELLLITVVPR